MTVTVLQVVLNIKCQQISGIMLLCFLLADTNTSQRAYLAHLIGPIKTRQASHSQPLNFPLLVLYSFSESRWEHRYKTDFLKRFFKVSCPYLQTLQSVCIHLF